MFKIITLGIIILGLIVLGGWYFISPVFNVVEVNDELPGQIGIDVSNPDSPGVDEIQQTYYNGNFVADAHDVEGVVKVISSDNGRILRFENFDTINGPDLRVYLSRDLENNDFIDIGELKATKGNINYNIPDDVDLTQYSNVLIWCRQFSVLFSHAKLE